MRSRSLKSGLAAGVLVALAALTACSGGGGGSSDSVSSSDAAKSGSAGDVGAAEPATGEDGSSAGRDNAGVNRAVVRSKAVIRTGEIAITAKDLSAVRREVDDLLVAVDGAVSSEQTSNDRGGRIESSTLVLRVPVEHFTAAKNALEKMGKLKTSDVRSKDVTNEVIDVDERVQTLQNSLDTLQGYQRDAKDVADLLDFEEKITTRQAELQSLQAQQAYLRDQTSMSTITLHLSTPEKYVAPPDALEDAGFLSGLRSGWHALGDVVVVSLTVLGALLPFVLAGLLLGVPTWIGIRSLLRRRRATPPPALPDSP